MKLLLSLLLSIAICIPALSKSKPPYSKKRYKIKHTTIIEKQEGFHPGDILQMDTFLIFSDQLNPPYIKVYNSRGIKVKEFLNPDRMYLEYGIEHLEKIDSSLYAYENKFHHAYQFTLSQISNKNITNPQYVKNYSFPGIDKSFSGPPYEYRMGRNNIIMQTRSTGGRIAVLKSNGFGFSQGGEYPPKTNDSLYNVNHYQLYNSNMALNNDFDKVALATKWNDMLDVYDISQKKIKKIWSYHGDTIQTYIIGVRRGWVRYPEMTDESTYGYADIASTDNYIYALYSGKKKAKTLYNYGKTIRVASWDGSERYELKTDVHILRLSVSEDDRYIYAIAGDDEERRYIVRFDLKKIRRKK